jgi:hypothetical protein
MKYLSLTVAASALLLAPATAHAQLFGGFDNSTVLGGLTGAGIGGAIGSNLAGSGNRDEGTAIGAALGGLAGAAYGNSRSNYYGNPYAGSFNPGFSGNSLLGTAIGAGIGGAIGSNLAGSGVRQEGTAIGAVLGGLAGNALTSRSRYGNSGFGGNAGFGAPAFGAPGFGAPAFGGGFVPPSYGPAFPPVGLPPVGLPPIGLPPMPAPQFGATLPPIPMGGTSLIPGGFVEAGTFANTTTILPPAMPAPIPTFVSAPAPAPVFQPLSNAFTGVTVAASNVTLAGPSYSAPTYSNSTRYGDSIGSTVTQDYVGSTGVVYQPKPLVLRGMSAPKRQVVVIERDHYTSSPSVVSTHSHNHGYTSAPVKSGPSITADTVNINYGNNSQVGTTSSNNGSTVGTGHGHGYTTPSYVAPTYVAPTVSHSERYSAPVAPVLRGSVNTGSYSVGSASVLGGYESSSVIAPASAGAGGSYYVGSGQTFLAPGAAEIAADCATSTFGCAGSASNSQSYNWNTAPASNTSYGTSYNHGYSHKAKSGGYSYCDSDNIYNDDGALLVGGSPVCR